MICEHCSKDFQLNKFGQGGKNRTACYECIPKCLSKVDRNKLRASLFQKKASDLKIGMGCKVCGYRKCAAALEWHHEGDDKVMAASDSIKKSWAEYLKEIAKCILLCANCHREIHD